MPPIKQPNLDTLTSVNADGSHHILHPSDVRGPYTFWRRLFGLALISVYVLLPWIPVGGFPADTYLWMVLLGLVPQLVGHSALNFALGYFPAAYVSLVVLGEPVGSGLLAIVFLGEWPVGVQLVGAVLVLAGIALATLERPLEKKPAAS